MELDFKLIDADNHYYEPLDGFTRHQTEIRKIMRDNALDLLGTDTI